MAARMGAGKVYLVDPSPVIQLAQFVSNAMSAGKSTDAILQDSRVRFRERFHRDRQFDHIVRGMIAKWKNEGG